MAHTGLSNTTNKQVLDSITEFYLLTKSEHIYMASYSGFSLIASKFRNVSCSKLEGCKPSFG